MLPERSKTIKNVGMSELQGKEPSRMYQQELLAECAPLSVAELHAYLNAGALLPVTIALNRNRVSMISVDFSPRKTVRVRMHHAFASAPRPVLAALRSYLRERDAADWQSVVAYARGIRVDSPRTVPSGRASGKVHDLDALGASVNRQFFDGSIKYRIQWGRFGRRRKGRGRSKSIRFGSWQESTRCIRIHSLLDDVRVPVEFVHYIVFHEMLHAAISSAAPASTQGRHDAFFRAQEQKYPRWAEMQLLSQKLLDVLV